MRRAVSNPAVAGRACPPIPCTNSRTAMQLIPEAARTVASWPLTIGYGVHRSVIPASSASQGVTCHPHIADRQCYHVLTVHRTCSSTHLYGSVPQGFGHKGGIRTNRNWLEISCVLGLVAILHRRSSNALHCDGILVMLTAISLGIGVVRSSA
ncbi:hypothetical protein BJY00DRAFT_197250 [Aspergillus carlsbadensis]|nr:hypothetical protein BJY00DRAFT_197250 [Aspergillus carlsbadensis]